MIDILPFLITYEKNFLIDNQYVVGFYNGWFQILDKNVNSFCKKSVLKNNFTTKQAIARSKSNSSTALANLSYLRNKIISARSF